MRKILVTGANGFIGSAVIKTLGKLRDAEPVGLIRTEANASLITGVRFIQAEINDAFAWSTTLSEIDCIVHCAGRAHVLKEKSSDPLAEFRKVNLHGTLALARAAASAGVRRFIFLSSIGVNGAATVNGVFDENSLAKPTANYAQSKLEAEQALAAISAEMAMEIVIIRPPLVYSADAPGNFARLMRLVSSGIPLPFNLVKNKRSMVALENLTDFIVTCVTHPGAANQTFLISDGADVSTPDILRYLARGMGLRLRLLPIPVPLLRLGAKAAGKLNLFEQLCGSLVIDSTKARDVLGWQPPVKPEDALIKAGQDYVRPHY